MAAWPCRFGSVGAQYIKAGPCGGGGLFTLWPAGHKRETGRGWVLQILFKPLVTQLLSTWPHLLKVPSPPRSIKPRTKCHAHSPQGPLGTMQIQTTATSNCHWHRARGKPSSNQLGIGLGIWPAQWLDTRLFMLIFCFSQTEARRGLWLSWPFVSSASYFCPLSVFLATTLC